MYGLQCISTYNIISSCTEISALGIILLLSDQALIYLREVVRNLTHYIACFRKRPEIVNVKNCDRTVGHGGFPGR